METINTKVVTIEDAIEMYEKKNQCIILSNGEVEGFTEKK